MTIEVWDSQGRKALSSRLLSLVAFVAMCFQLLRILGDVKSINGTHFGLFATAGIGFVACGVHGV